MNYTGKIITLAFPDTFVRLSDEPLLAWMVKSRIVGKGNYIKAGHAALVLIENATGKAEYYDFGRYVTPKGMGRVRSVVTDVELEIPFDASISSEGSLVNLDEFLLWLEANPQKTHGIGRLVSSVCDAIDYEKARAYILSLHSRGSIPYKAFDSTGASSNCSRLVNDAILASTDQPQIRKYLLRNRSFTPSTVGNVEKSALGNTIYQVYNGEIKQYSGTAFKENITNYFDKNIPIIGEEDKTKNLDHLKDAHFLSGTGCGAFFLLTDHVSYDQEMFQIQRFTEQGREDFKGVFKVNDIVFKSHLPYKFVYDSNCSYCHILQNEIVFRFDLITRIS